MRMLSDSTVDSGEHEKSIGQTVTVAVSKAEAGLVRKYDVWLLPTLIVMCLFQAVDKSLIGIAKINGIEADLGLTQTQYNVAISVFQVGYRLLQIPSNLLLTRIRPSIYLPFCCLAWSTVAACHVLVQNYTGLLIVRVLLGVCDAPFWVGSMHVLGSWYTKSELVSRTSVLLASVIVGFVAISPMSAGIIQSLEGRLGWSGWRWLYLIFGLSGFAPAILGLFTLPDYPESPKRRFWLSQTEQELAKKRIDDDRVDEGQVKRQKVWSGLRDAVEDVKTWVFVLIFTSRNSVEGLLYYLPAIINSFHFFPDSQLTRNTVTLMLNSPPALLAAALALFLAFTSNRYKERTFHLVVPLGFALVAFVLSATATDAIARYISMYFYLGGSVSSSGLAWSWVPNAIQETPEKKACALAIVSVFGGLGSVWAPFLFRKQDYPGYRLAFIVMSCFAVMEISCSLWMRHVLKRQNQRVRQEEHNSESNVNIEHSRLHLL